MKRNDDEHGLCTITYFSVLSENSVRDILFAFIQSGVHKYGSSYEFVGLSELQFLYLDRIYPSTIFRSYGTNRIDWIYCFLCFRPPAHRGLSPGGTKQRNGNPAFSGKEKPKKPIVLLPKNSLEEGF